MFNLRVIFLHKKHTMENKIWLLSQNTSKRMLGKFTDKLIVVENENNTVLLGKSDLEKIEQIVGAKFKA